VTARAFKLMLPHAASLLPAPPFDDLRRTACGLLRLLRDQDCAGDGGKRCVQSLSMQDTDTVLPLVCLRARHSCRCSTCAVQQGSPSDSPCPPPAHCCCPL
jgi:hypothetical protein